MTHEFRTMLEMFQCAAHGTNCSADADVDFLKLKQKAIEHGTWEVLFENYKDLFLKKHTDETAVKCMEKETQMVLERIVRDIRKKEVLKSILSECKENGIVCILLKGFFFAQLYAEPDFRISGDIDLYIDEKCEEKVVGILSQHGFNCAKRLKTEYHRECMSKTIGLIELHVSLYDSYCKDIWFKNTSDSIAEPLLEIEATDGYKYTVLGYTDNCIFSVLHFIKHFIGGGVGIRQLMDIMLFVEKYKDRIDIKKYTDLMHDMHYDALMDAMSHISVKYLGFKKENLIFCQKTSAAVKYTDEILNIIEDGGLFGKHSDELNGFSEIYTEMCLRKNGDNYSNLIIRNIRKNGFFNSIFVNRKQLSDKYSYAQKNILLLPIAWIHRLLNGIFNMRRIKTDPLNNKKIDILKNLKVID